MSPVPSHEQLLADSAWLSRLAQSFVTDPSTGEDLAQDTWLLAVHEGVRGRAVGRGWLRETLRSRLWNLRRNEGNRRAREAEHAVHPHSPSALDLVARAELQQRVAEALTGLPEPLRTTALLRFLDGLSTAQIGKRMDVPADTVRDRLARAVALLRNVLQPSDQSALAAFLPGSLATSLGASAAAGPTTWTLGGVMMKKAVAVVAVVLVGITVRTQWPPSAVSRPPMTPVVEAETVELAAPVHEELAGVADVGPAESERTVVQAQMAAGALGVTVLLRTPEGRAVDGTYVRLSLLDKYRTDAESLSQRTDEGGRTFFSAEDVARVRAQLPTSSIRVEQRTTIHPAVYRDFAPGVLPEDPVVLELDMMRVVVGAQTPDGELWAGNCGLNVSPDDLHYTSSSGPVPRIGWVPRGRGYKLKVYRCGTYRDAVEHFPPPGNDETEREHLLQLGPALPAITGVVLGPGGEPIPAKTELWILDRSLRGNGSRWTSALEGGRFEYALRLGETAGTQRVFEFSIADGGHRHAAARRVQFEVPADGVILDLGALTLQRQPLLASGRLTAPAGHRFQTAAVSVDVMSRNEWVRHPVLDNCVFLNAEGEFAVYGPDLPGPERIVAVTTFRQDLAELVPAWAPELQVGSTDLVLPLVRPGSMRAFLDVDQPGLTSDASLALFVNPEGQEGEFHLRTLSPEDGVFADERIPPGVLRIDLLPTSEGAPIASWASIRIREGKETDLGTLTLNSPVHEIELRLTEPQAGRLWVRYGPAGVRPLVHSGVLRDGVIRLVSRGESFDVLVVGDGVLPELLLDVRGSTDVHLRPAPELEVELIGARELFQEYRDATSKLYLRITLEPEDVALGEALSAADMEALRVVWYTSLSRQPPKQRRLAVRAPGTYSVRVDLPTQMDAFSERTGVPELTPSFVGPSFDVSGEADRVRVEVDLRKFLESRD